MWLVLEQVVKGGMLLKLRLNSNGEVGGDNQGRTAFQAKEAAGSKALRQQ